MHPPIPMRPVRRFPRLLLLPATAVVVLFLAGCASPTPRAVTATLRDDPARPAAARWIRTELYFGLGRLGEPEARAAQWQTYLDREVTPRFPDGLTVLDAYGQWRRRGGDAAPGRLLSKVLIILHEDTPQRNAEIEALRLAWKQATGDQSVLRVSQPADVSF